MKIQFLGTGAGIPSKQRNVSSLALKLLDERNEIWLFDCGEATQHQILKTTIRPRKVTKIFITHLHGDHIFGLPGFLSSRSFQGGESQLVVYGPPGIKAFIEGTLKYSKTNLTYLISIVELDPKGGYIDLANGWTAHYLPLEHGVLCFGYRITEPDAVGELQVDRLAEFNLPNGPIFGQLKRGETVILPDGRTIDGKDYIGPDRKGKIITILGDTRPVKNAEILAEKAHVLVHESTHEAEEAKMARAYFHSTSVQAATLARDSQVGTLYLNHISARYLGKQIYALQKEAQSVFSKSYVVNDFEEFDVEDRINDVGSQV